MLAVLAVLWREDARVGVGDGDLIGQRLGEFRLESLLGSGGMAEVYRALDLRLNREVAVKVLPPTLAADSSYVVRFRTEARRVAALNHPHIVPLYHYGEIVLRGRRLLYQVMPIFHESLRDRLNREGALSPTEACRIAVEVASALEAAHEMGLVHRDVKPENILLDQSGKAFLTDFGIAREAMFLRQPGVIQTLSATGLPVGTPEYMAPEQLRGGPVDQRADIYALGTVLYEMLRGVVPYEAETPYEVASLVLTAPLVPPSTQNPAINRGLEAAIMRAMAPHPADRYPDARSFAEALTSAIAEPDTLSVRVVGAWPRKTRRIEALPTTPPPAPSQWPRWRPSYSRAAGGAMGKKAAKRAGILRRILIAVTAIVLLAGAFVAGGALINPDFPLPWRAQGHPAIVPTTTATSAPLPTATLLPTVTPLPTATPRPTPTPTPRPTPTATPIPVGTGLSGQYFTNTDLSGTPAQQRTDATINFTTWGSDPPIPGVATNYSVRWTGYVVPQYTETYTFTTNSDDGVRLVVDNQLIFNNWTNHPPTINTGLITLTAGKRYAITLDYFQGNGGAVIQLFWQSDHQGQDIVPQSALFPS